MGQRQRLSTFNHRALGLGGTNYDVAIFDDLDHAGKDGLVEMREVEDKISAKCYLKAESEEEEGELQINGCVSAAEVKNHLKRL